MPDLVVTVPRDLWLDWIDEGDAVGEPETGEEWGFFCGWANRSACPPAQPGDRLYVVSHDRLRGYAPVTRVVNHEGRWAIGRRGGAVAVTIPDHIVGFRGWRRRWWDRSAEVPFPEWRTADLWLNRGRGRARKAREKAARATGQGARKDSTRTCPQEELFR